eukprot:2600603-Amphidinium_carterae.1
MVLSTLSCNPTLSRQAFQVVITASAACTFHHDRESQRTKGVPSVKTACTCDDALPLLSRQLHVSSRLSRQPGEGTSCEGFIALKKRLLHQVAVHRAKGVGN